MPSYYERNKERILAEKKARYAANPEKYLTRVKAYNQTPEGRETQRRREDKRQSTVEGRKIVNARKLICRRVHRKTWPKAAVFLCAHCDHRAEEYHHHDYDQPAAVLPLCRRCHQALHNSLPEAA